MYCQWLQKLFELRIFDISFTFSFSGVSRYSQLVHASHRRGPSSEERRVVTLQIAHQLWHKSPAVYHRNTTAEFTTRALESASFHHAKQVCISVVSPFLIKCHILHTFQTLVMYYFIYYLDIVIFFCCYISSRALTFFVCYRHAFVIDVCCFCHWCFANKVCDLSIDLFSLTTM